MTKMEVRIAGRGQSTCVLDQSAQHYEPSHVIFIYADLYSHLKRERHIIYNKII